MSLLAVGTVAFDSIETPFGKVDYVIGGAATYIGWAASYLTKPIHIVSIVGEDFPDDEIAQMQGRGINTDGVKVVEGGKSFYWAGRYHADMNARDTLVTDLNVLAEFDPVVPESARKAPYLMLGNLTPDIQMSVISQMEERPRLIVLDTMNFWMDNAWDNLMKVIRHIDVLTINDEEARQMSGEFSLVKAARKIQELGPKYLVIKKGEHGALLFHGDQLFFAPGLPLLEVWDPTGAGDTFAGGFMGHIAKTGDLSFENMKRAVIYGSTMASFCVEDMSLGKLKMLSDQEIRSRLLQFKDLVHFDI